MPYRLLSLATLVAGLMLTLTSHTQAAEPTAGQADGFKDAEEQRTGAYAAQLEAWLRDYLVTQYPQRAAGAWKRDYSSPEAYARSVESQREGWRKVV